MRTNIDECFSRSTIFLLFVFFFHWVGGCSFLREAKEISLKSNTFYIDVVLSSLKDNKKRPILQTKIMGPPDQIKVIGKDALFLGKGSVLVLEMPLPEKRYSQSIDVYLPKETDHRGTYRIWSSSSPKGPWEPIGIASKRQSFDVNGARSEELRYLKFEDITLHSEGVWLDAIKIRLHSETWIPEIKRAPDPNQSNLTAEAFVNLALQEYQKGEFKQSAIFAKKALRRDSNYATAHSQLAASFFGLKKMYLSLYHYKQARRLAPLLANHLREIGEIYMNWKLLQRSKETLIRCIQLAPLNEKCYHHLIYLSSKQKNKKGFHLFREYYLAVSNQAKIKINRWDMTTFFRKTFPSKKSLLQSNSPDFNLNDLLQWHSILIHLFPNETEQVTRMSRKGIQDYFQDQKAYSPKNQELFYALLIARNGDLVNGISRLQQLKKENRDSVLSFQLFLHLGDLFEQAGNRKKTLAIYQQAIKYFSDRPEQQIFLKKKNALLPKE